MGAREVLGCGIDSCEIETEMGESWVSPRVHIDPRLCKFRRCQSRDDDLLLRTETSVDASTMNQMTADVMKGRAGTANHALLGVMSEAVERRQT